MGVNYLLVALSFFGLIFQYLSDRHFILHATKVTGVIAQQHTEGNEDDERARTVSAVNYSYLGKEYSLSMSLLKSEEKRKTGDAVELLVHKTSPAFAKVNTLWNLYDSTYMGGICLVLSIAAVPITDAILV